jgi:hypothetical protein
MGYSLRAMGWIDRLPHAIVGVLLLMPAGAFAAARWLNIAGALMAVALIAWERTMRRSARPQPEPVLQTPISTPQSVAPHVSLDQLGIRNSDGM